MNAPQRPAYLQNSPSRNINETALLGIGSALPPHISIRGNQFTLVDASGAQMPAGNAIHVCIADLSDHVCKQFYADKWTPDSNEPPVCWSANGVAPSVEAMEPQSVTCETCPQNVRGSAVSQLSGAAIKACRDERWLAVIIPQYPTMRFQLRLTPGSFKSWREYVNKCTGSGMALNEVLTQVSFASGQNGVLVFQAVDYIDEPTAVARDKGYAENAFDALVGRLDRPRQAALPAPATAALPIAPLSPLPPPAAPMPTYQPQPMAAQAPFGAPAAATPSMPAALPSQAAPTPATAAFPSNPPQAQQTAFQQPAGAPAQAAKRTLPPRAQMAAAKAPAPQNGAPAQAPFRPQAQQLPQATNPQNFQGGAPVPAAPGFAVPQAPPAFGAAPAAVAQPGNPNPAAYGMAQGVPPNAEINQALDGLFGQRPA